MAREPTWEDVEQFSQLAVALCDAPQYIHGVTPVYVVSFVKRTQRVRVGTRTRLGKPPAPATKMLEVWCAHVGEAFLWVTDDLRLVGITQDPAVESRPWCIPLRAGPMRVGDLGEGGYVQLHGGGAPRVAHVRPAAFHVTRVDFADGASALMRWRDDGGYLKLHPTEGGVEHAVYYP